MRANGNLREIQGRYKGDAKRLHACTHLDDVTVGEKGAHAAHGPAVEFDEEALALAHWRFEGRAVLGARGGEHGRRMGGETRRREAQR